MISEKLLSILRRELALEDFDFAKVTFAYEVPGWDSLNHVNILSAIEREYRVRFRPAEIMGLQKIEDLQTVIDTKLVVKS